MTVAEIMAKMISFSEGNIHDIDHLIRVWTYAKTISSLEELEAETQYVLEVAAITHDIACPMCREMYGNTNGKLPPSFSKNMFRLWYGHTLIFLFLARNNSTGCHIWSAIITPFQILMEWIIKF